VKAGGARPRPAEIVAVDCHAHVMRRDAPRSLPYIDREYAALGKLAQAAQADAAIGRAEEAGIRPEQSRRGPGATSLAAATAPEICLEAS
jgi:hypothetical protein